MELKLAPVKHIDLINQQLHNFLPDTKAKLESHPWLTSPRNLHPEEEQKLVYLHKYMNIHFWNITIKYSFLYFYID